MADSAAPQDGQMIDEIGGGVQPVGDQDAGASLLLEAPQVAAQRVGGDLIQAGEGFVEEQDRRVVQGGPGKGQALFHAAREVAHPVVAPFGQPGFCQRLIDPLFPFLQKVSRAVRSS